MTTQETRLSFAKSAMHGILSNPNARFYDETENLVNQVEEIVNAMMARFCPEPEADADGWIVRIPTDPLPSKHNGVRFTDGAEDLDANYRWPEEWWRHSDDALSEQYHITHYRP